jgi:hypothetical protein
MKGFIKIFQVCGDDLFNSSQVFTANFFSEGKVHDADKNKNPELGVHQQSDIGNKPFIAANRPLEKGFHGGWEGTFAAMHGGYPHMFENLAPSKTKTWLGQTSSQPISNLPILVPFAHKGGPGFPNRGIAADAPYISEKNYEQVERLNRQLRLGDGGGFRPDMKPLGGPWITSNAATGVAFDGMAPFQPVSPPRGSHHRAAGQGGAAAEAATTTAGRAAHNAPFVCSAWQRRLPSQTFSSFGYAGEPFVDDPYRLFDRMVREQVCAPPDPISPLPLQKAF